MDDSSNESADDERLTIRDELKSLSFEELLKLKEEVGTKYYSKVFSSKQEDNELQDSKKSNHGNFKRGNKNRPREESSKIPGNSIQKIPKKESLIRDPRFDTLCGEFNETAFTRNYSFVNDIRDKEIKQLKIMYKKEKDSDQKGKIKLALQAMTNQQKSRLAREIKLKEKQEERESNLKLIKEGNKPHFRRKGEKKAISLINKYEQLKSDGKLEKYVKKKNKTQARKSFSVLSK